MEDFSFRSRQDFNIGSEEFESESQLKERKRTLCSKIDKSHLSNCTLCINNPTQHKMRVQYLMCKLSDCPNRGQPCFRILKCSAFSRFSLSTSRLHLNQSRAAPIRSDANPDEARTMPISSNSGSLHYDWVLTEESPQNNNGYIK